MTAEDGWQAYFVKEVDFVGVYDIYKDDAWIAQVKWPRRKGLAPSVLIQKGSAPETNYVRAIRGRDQWRTWLQEHQGNL